MSDQLDKLEVFFNQNKSKLEESYPGLSFSILKQEFQDYCFINSIPSQSEGGRSEIEVYLEHLNQGTPLSYIKGSHFFYENEFLVNENTLIPRSETEILVHEVLQLVKGKDSLRMIDVGTGTGIIGLSILAAHAGKIDMILSDISSAALEVAKQNAWRLRHQFHPESSIEFIESDRLESVSGQFDVILTNPPYIKEKNDRKLVHDQVLEFEPHLALFLPDNEYDTWFEQFFTQIKSTLNSQGLFYMEGHEDHLERLREMASNAGFINLQIVNDLTSRPRFLIGEKG